MLTSRAASLGSRKQVREVFPGNGHCTAVQRGGYVREVVGGEGGARLA